MRMYIHIYIYIYIYIYYIYIGNVYELSTPDLQNLPPMKFAGAQSSSLAVAKGQVGSEVLHRSDPTGPRGRPEAHRKASKITGGKLGG